VFSCVGVYVCVCARVYVRVRVYVYHEEKRFDQLCIETVRDGIPKHGDRASVTHT
jgi:hypothetical protein